MKRFLPFFLALASACSADKVLTDRQYFESATNALRDEDYDVAVEQYQKLMEEYPFSGYSEEAQLKAAYSQYMNEQYAEAIASFQDFQRMHPTNPNLAFAEYYLALSYKDQMGKTDRDQRAAENAHQHFQSVIDRYPESPYAAKAREKLHEIRESLAEHELAVAKFYLHWGNPLGAESRLRQLVTVYPDTSITAEGLNVFGAWFRKRGDLRRAALAYASVVQKYPQSDSAADARDAVAALDDADVKASGDPLAELLETLGRPAVEVAAPAEPVNVDPGPTSQVDRDTAVR